MPENISYYSQQLSLFISRVTVSSRRRECYITYSRCPLCPLCPDSAVMSREKAVIAVTLIAGIVTRVTSSRQQQPVYTRLCCGDLATSVPRNHVSRGRGPLLPLPRPRHRALPRLRPGLLLRRARGPAPRPRHQHLPPLHRAVHRQRGQVGGIIDIEDI